MIDFFFRQNQQQNIRRREKQNIFEPVVENKTILVSCLLD